MAELSEKEILRRLRVFYTSKEARLWLDEPHPLLAEERPADLIRAGRGDEVLAVIDRLETGAYL